MPPPRALKKGDRIFCLLKNEGRYSYEIAFRGNAGDTESYVIEVGSDWLCEPENEIDELLLVEVKVLKRLTRQPQKAKVKIE